MAQPKIRIAIIICSTRTPRVGLPITTWVTSVIAPTVPPSALLETIDLANYPLPLSPSGSRIPAKITSPGVPVPKGAYGNEQVDAWSQKVAEFDGFIFVTPQYNWSVPGVLKVALDHLFYEWVTKPIVIVSYGGRGGGKAALALQEIWKGLRGGECVRAIELTIAGAGMEKAQTQGELDDVVREEWEKDKKVENIVGSFAKLVEVVQEKRKVSGLL
jgi:NAD(P)H-dependent FMN reductase